MAFRVLSLAYKVPRLPIASARLHDDGFDFWRWCSWAHTAKRTQFTGTLLLLFWSGIEATDPNLAGLGSFVPQTPSASNFKDSSKPQLITSSETLNFLQAGVNPFHILSKQNDVEAPESNFEKVVDLTVRAARLDLQFAGVLDS